VRDTTFHGERESILVFEVPRQRPLIFMREGFKDESWEEELQG
jgi:hypothetical protein